MLINSYCYIAIALINEFNYLHTDRIVHEYPFHREYTVKIVVNIKIIM